MQKKNVLEGYRAAHRVKGKADNRYHSRWTLSEVRSQRQQHHRHIQPQLSIQQISKWFWRSSVGQDPPLSQGTLMADCNWGGVVAVGVFLSEWREEKCRAGGSGGRCRLPSPFPVCHFLSVLDECSMRYCYLFHQYIQFTFNSVVLIKSSILMNSFCFP